MTPTQRELAELLAAKKSQPARPVLTQRSLTLRPECQHLGGRVGQSCGSILRECGLHECVTTVYTPCVEAKRLCAKCPDYSTQETALRTPTWAYCITTVPSRKVDLFPRTLRSLAEAGFPTPSVFVDGAQPSDATEYANLGLSHATLRLGAPAKTFGNWVLSLYETYIRNPNCDRYAVFQDDFVTSKNLRTYLDRIKFPVKGYLNLYTFPSNSFSALRQRGLRTPPDGFTGWYKSNQLGRGAVALVFDRDGVMELLKADHMVTRPTHPSRGTKAVDGAIVSAMNKAGYNEFVHYPTLVQHTGEKSSMGNQPHQQGIDFRGEEADAATFPVNEVFQ